MNPGALLQAEVKARLRRFVSWSRGIKQALPNEWFPAEPKQCNADRYSGDRDRVRIVAEQNHERSAIGEKIRFHQGLAQAAGPSAWLGENT